MPAKNETLLDDLRQLRAAADQARAADAEEAREDLAALRALLPLPPSGRARTRAAALLARLTDRRSLAALGHDTVEDLIASSSLRLSPSTARRLIATTVAAPPNATQLRRLDQLERRIRKHLRAADLHAWDIGNDFDRIAGDRLHRLREPITLAQWADRTYPEHGYRTLSRYRRIARSFSRATAARFGTTKLDLGLRYLDLTPADDRPAELSRLRIQVPNKAAIPFAKITLSDLERAVDALATTVSTPKQPDLPRGASRLATRARTALDKKRLPAGHPRPTITTRTIRLGNTQTVLFTAHDIPQDMFERWVATIV